MIETAHLIIDILTLAATALAGYLATLRRIGRLETDVASLRGELRGAGVIK